MFSEKPGLANLPTQPLELRSYLLGPAAFGGSPVAAAPPSSAPEQSPESVRLTRIIADLLTENLTQNALTPAQRIAIVEVLSSLDGVTVDLRSLDPAGRPAYELVFETTSGPTRYQVFVDPASHDVLAVLETIPRNGDVTNATIAESVSIVASTDESDQTGESAIPAPDRTVLDRWLRLGEG